jgi:hypothetical protein
MATMTTTVIATLNRPSELPPISSPSPGERLPDKKDSLNVTFDGTFMQYVPEETDLIPEELSSSNPPLINTIDVQRNYGNVQINLPCFSCLLLFVDVGSHTPFIQQI